MEYKAAGVADRPKSEAVRLLYLTYQESITVSGILHTQVVQMLERMAELGRAGDIMLLSFLSPQQMWTERHRLVDLKVRLREKGIRLITAPMLIPGRWKMPWALAFLLWVMPVMWVAVMRRCTVFHPRGYAAGMLAMMAGKLLGVPFIFDPRGPYPDEMVMNGIWKDGSFTHRVWRCWENLLIRRAAAVIGVTPEFRDEFQARGARQAVFIPNRAETERFAAAAREYRESARYRAREEAPELLFTGEMVSVWNSPEVVGRQFAMLSSVFPDARLRLLTNAKFDRITPTLEAQGVDISKVRHEARRPEEMPAAMPGATLGLIMRVVNVHSIWSVKIAEYLAAGIPILADCSMTGLPLKIILKHRLGFVADPQRPEDYAIVSEIIRDWEQWSNRCREYARRRLDIRSTARQHLRIYRQCLK